MTDELGRVMMSDDLGWVMVGQHFSKAGCEQL